ncbi:MAG: hypothetical protein AYK22_08100 [Thermoplasmatales archaeon SG8-52-3]|nr:MAG: hypothetical protein AYK22_08100 [Thermoplasmatales archaeon SG8-52-3]
MRSKLLTKAIIILFIFSNINILFISNINADEIEPQWPTDWILFDSDPTENGDSDDYRDVSNAYYHANDNYLYFRLECYGYPNFTIEPDCRYKWFIDIDDPHNMGQSGGNVFDAEYMLFIEDSPKPGGDGIGDIYLLADLDNDGLIQDDWPDYETSPGPILDDSIAGYRIIDNYIDLYIKQENISFPTNSYLTWATDQEDPNLDSAPNIDRSNSYWDADLTKADLSITKSASINPVIAGESFVYDITVTNHGPHIAHNVTILDTLPPDVEFNSANPIPTGSNGSEYWWVYSQLGVGDSIDISINVTADIDFSGEISNVAVVYSDTYDPVPGNNEDTEETEICEIFYLLTNIDGNGTITINPEKDHYLSGETVELTAVSDLGWSFKDWSGSASDTNETITILMDSDKEITAHFTQDHYMLGITINGNGSVGISPDIESYTYGTIVLLDAIPEIGWKFDHWSGDLTGSDNPASIIMTGDKDIVADFSQEHYNLNITINGNGVVDISPDNEDYTYGTIVLLNAIPEIGWKFDHWSGDLTGSDNPASIIMTGDKDIVAYFTQIHYNLNISINGNGSLNCSPDIESYTYGTIVLLNAIPDPGWRFDYWSGDLTGTDNPAIVNMTGDKDIVAYFSQEHYTLNITINGKGVVDISPDNESYLYGAIVELSADPASGWRFDYWSGDLTGTDNPATINMTSDKNITANFKKKTYNPGDNGGGYSDPFVPVSEPNIPPVANAGGPYYGTPGEDILFNASLSYDPDQHIESWSWDFGDGIKGQGSTINHNYSLPGEYIVNLTVIDNEDASDKDTTIAVIIKPNSPPSSPEINGPFEGIVDIEYNFSFVFNDEDNDTIKIIIDWGDGNVTESDFIAAGQVFNASHSWKESGVYKITVIGDDNETTTTEDFEITINEPEPDIPEQNNLIFIILLILGLLLLLLFYLLSTGDKRKEEENNKK